LTTKGTGDLFDRLRPPADGEKRPQQEAQIRPEQEDRVNDSPDAKAFLQVTVDQWMDVPGMHTIELSSPRGRLWLTKSRKEHKRLVAAGEVVFSPLEVERLIELVRRDKGAISERLLDHIYQLKKMDPGAKLEEMAFLGAPFEEMEPVEPDDARPA